MMNQDPFTPKRLSKAVGHSCKKNDRFLRHRKKMMAEFASRFYTQDEMDEAGRKPMNLMFIAATTLIPNLVYRHPQASISSRVLQYRFYAETLALATNQVCKEIDLKTTLRMALTDALFACGWVKTGLAAGEQSISLDGELFDVGQVYADYISCDEMVFDATAKSCLLDSCLFIGNKFTKRKSALYEMGLDHDMVRKVCAASKKDKQDGVAALSGGKEEWADPSVDEFVELVEIYIPSQRRIVIMPNVEDGEWDEPYLADFDFNGPERGPYHQLSLVPVPDNIWPIPLAYMWWDFHQTINRVLRKSARQAERQKSVLAYEADGWEDAEAVRDADDGGVVKVEDVDRLTTLTYGGADPSNYQWIQQAKHYFSEAAMNIDLLSGQASNESTATEAQMLQGNSSIRIDDLRDGVYNFAAGVMESIAFYLHTDPLIELPMTRRVRGTDEQIVYTPEMREGDWIDYTLNIVPYSMGRKDPAQKSRQMMEFVGKILPSLANTWQMLQGAFNLPGAIRATGRELGLEPATIEELVGIIDEQMLEDTIKRQQMLQDASMQPQPKQPSASPASGGGVRVSQPNPRGAIPDRYSASTDNRRFAQQGAASAQAETSPLYGE